ncbi:DUF1835 domain-containing protein [Mucilaginibacter limnophilus]|uniref:DUF1835 domain-containing protein n=1 Tax=Mucilaginibacter limnophilus TaxID=1932778 RepID=A0A3S2UQ60_9SPHI|nr:DUF1835 domain-containing protein [Mucilaginibacter limnophilus]RVU01732.1 DUF1835 domain-containing protein [Mucilaginibacter limnophilus]
MSNILHILNGDSTFNSFKQTGLEGDALIWREVLSEGPLTRDVSSAAFWEAREQWITNTFAVPADDYRHNLVDKLGMLNEPYAEYNLWFEFDLHCQVNLLGVMNLLRQKADMSEPAFYLICPDTVPGRDDFRGMGELSGKELEYLYDNIRLQLTEYDFSLAAEGWNAYVSGDPVALNEFITKTNFWGGLHLLKPALEAHLKRLQVNTNGLNYIEQKLQDIYNSGMITKHGIYKAFWKDEKIYGMGDSEIDIYLNKLGII